MCADRVVSLTSTVRRHRVRASRLPYGFSRAARPTYERGGYGTPLPRRYVGMSIHDTDVRLNDIEVTTINGEKTTLAHLASRVTLIVNVASRCGFTPQYKALERLYETYGDRGFTVLGFPTNQFLQELGSSEKIKDFCDAQYGVTFPMFETVQVNGRHAHPLFKELTKAPDASGKAGRVRWNFEKFLVTSDGVVHRFRTKVEPDAPEIIALIEAALR
jgi:glutathione peroxidase